MAAMTTPRDDIAGLSERLRLISGVMMSAIAKNVPVTVWKIDLVTMAEAATAIDALRCENNDFANEVARYKSYAEKFEQENAALQARVKELEDECFRLAADTCHAGYGDEHGNHRCREVDQANARALRAEQERADEWSRRREAESQRDVAKAAVDTMRQERDEAVVAIKFGLDVISEDRGWGTYQRMEGSEIYMDADTFREAAHDLLRRLAGPEKEGK